MKSFRLFISTIGIIVNSFASNTFCTENNNIIIDSYSMNQENVILNIPTKDFFSNGFYCYGLCEEHCDSGNFYEQVSIKRSLINKYPVLKNFTSIYKISEHNLEYNFEHYKKVSNGLKEYKIKLESDNSITTDDSNMLSNIFSKITCNYNYAYSIMLSETCFG